MGQYFSPRWDLQDQFFIDGYTNVRFDSIQKGEAFN